MAFAVSGGSLQRMDRAVYQAPVAVNLADNVSRAYAEIFRAQPEVRTCVSFLARNIAQLNLHVFRRVSETDRERLRDHPFAALMGAPNPTTTPYRFMRALVSDIGIYDESFHAKVRGPNGEPQLWRIPPSKIKVGGVDVNAFYPEYYEVQGSHGRSRIAADRVLHLHGYNPLDDRTGLSPIETLRRILAEEFAASIMREQTLRNGARVSGYITRPTGAEWSDTARTRFKNGWRSQYLGQTATEGGGTPILEDGMQFVPASHSAVDLQYVESRKLTREEVAAAYHIPPPMVGILDHATFGNIEQQHKMLYQDTLGPWIQEIQQDLMLQVLPEFPARVRNVYIEFNLAEKLRGSFEEQARSLQSSVGAPYMTRNEARSRMNLPQIEGGDLLVVPLNVLEGGMASPQDTAPEPEAGEAARAIGWTKARLGETYTHKAKEVIAAYFARQGETIQASLGAKSDSWWDGKRWDRELGASLFALALTLSTAAAKAELALRGFTEDDYDSARTLEYLRAVSGIDAKNINAATKAQIDAALLEDDPKAAVVHVFDVAKESRASQAAVTLATGLAAFAAVEALKQVRGTNGGTKTWVTNSKNPRASHARMNGQTVPLEANFSNGARWPGDSVNLGVDETAGCVCGVQIDYE